MPRPRPSELSDVQRAESARYAFQQKQSVLRRYRKLGLEWGLFVGAVLGMLGAGAQMSRWESPFLGWSVTTAAFAGIGGALGFLFYDLIFGSQIRAALDGGLGGSGDDGAGANGDGGGDGG